MSDDEQREYDLAVLLEDIERTVLKESDRVSPEKIRAMFDKARMSGVVRYPQP